MTISCPIPCSSDRLARPDIYKAAWVLRVDPNAKITSSLLASVLRAMVRISQPYFRSRLLLRKNVLHATSPGESGEAAGWCAVVAGGFTIVRVGSVGRIDVDGRRSFGNQIRTGGGDNFGIALRRIRVPSHVVARMCIITIRQ